MNPEYEEQIYLDCLMDEALGGDNGRSSEEVIL